MTMRMVENEPEKYPPEGNDFQMSCYERGRDMRAKLLAEIAKLRHH
jgi:hypothetical protein